MAYHLNLKTRILSGFMLPLALLVGVCALVYLDAQSLQRTTLSVREAQRVVMAATGMEAAYQQMLAAVRGLVIGPDEATRRSYQAGAREYQDARALLGRLVHDATQLERLRAIDLAAAQLAKRNEALLALSDAGRAAEALATARAHKGTELATTLEQNLQEFIAGEHAILLKRDDQQKAELEGLVWLVLAATGAAILISLITGTFIAGRISGLVRGAILDMGSSTSQIAATIDEHDRTVTQQAAAVNETTATVEELGASARQSADQAESTAEAARNAFESARNGTHLADQVAESMAEMKDKVISVGDQIQRLSEQAGQIGEIARVVSEIAVETKMLSLNAAVEAARAGEDGKGFSVVAAEVRKLAIASKKSAERANDLVVQIQKVTNAAVMVTEGSIHTAESVAALTQETLESFSAITSSANSVAVSAQQVLLNSKQQAIALEQVTTAMKSLSAGSVQISAGTKQTQVGVRKLDEVAQGLKALV